MNTDLYMIYNILLETVWWLLSNAILIMEICLVVLEIIANEICSYWWSDISVICCHFCISHIYANSTYFELFNVTWFVIIGLLIVEIQVEWSLWQKYLEDLLRKERSSQQQQSG